MFGVDSDGLIDGVESDAMLGVDSVGILGVDRDGILGMDGVGILGMDSDGILGVESLRLIDRVESGGFIDRVNSEGLTFGRLEDVVVPIDEWSVVNVEGEMLVEEDSEWRK